MFRHWGLKKQFATVFLVLITLPTVLFGCLIYYQTTKTFKQQAEANTIARLEKNEDNLTSIIRGIENMSSYMIYDDNFRTFFKTSEEDTLETAYKRAEEGIRGYFTFQLTSFDYIDSILLVGKDGHSLEFGNPVTADEENLNKSAKQKEGGLLWSDAYEVTSDWDGRNKVISLSRVINDIRHISQPIGMVRIRLDQADLYQTVEADPSKMQGDYFVMSDTGEVVLHPDKSLVGKPFPSRDVIDLVVNSDKATMNYETNDDTYLVVKKPIEGTDWLSVAVVNEGEVVKELYNIRTLIVDMIILLILLGIIAFIGFYFFNIKRIIELTQQTKQLETGNFSANVKINSEDEIGRLGIRFNHMVKTIQNHINLEYKLKIRQKESELKALQSQIDPHFLYNTLDMIRWTARLEKAMETGQLIERLSKIFRINLNMGKMWIPLQEEIMYIQNYLELHKSRLGDRLRFSIFYDYQIRDALLIKQILQPLVENSILHGFKNLPRQGVITVHCYKVEEEVWIDVIDNGWGFAKQKEETVKQHTGFALNNIKERLDLVFGEGFGIDHLNVEVGAWIRLKLPLLYEENKKSIIKESGE